jgi:hypothetical protein
MPPCAQLAGRAVGPSISASTGCTGVLLPWGTTATGGSTPPVAGISKAKKSMWKTPLSAERCCIIAFVEIVLIGEDPMLTEHLMYNERRIEINKLSLAALKSGNHVWRNGHDVTAEQRARLIDQIENLEAANAILRGAQLSRA